MLTEERISADKHFYIVDFFSCGADNPLNNFLSGEAFKYDENKYGNTYLVVLEEDRNKIIGYYTLKTSGVQIQEDGEYSSIPVIEIARIAIHHEYQHIGIGQYIFYTYILPKVTEVARIVAVKAIIAFVDPDDEQAIGFYRSVGFERATDEVQKEIDDSFNEECDLYIVSLDNVREL